MSEAADNRGAIARVVDQLRRRRVVRSVTLYFLAGWPVIQIADILTPVLHLPDNSMQYLLLAFGVGFPVVIVLSWLFDLNKSGLAMTAEATTGQAGGSSEPLVGPRTESLVIVGLALIIAVLFFLQYSEPNRNTRADGTYESPLAAPRSIAVLPFAIFSATESDSYFADGLTEELLNALSRVKELQVAARTSSFAYRGVNRHVQEIGRELNVESILEGSVRRNDIDDTIRVTAQLIDVRTGSHLWSQTYNRKFRDIFRIQDEISKAVVDQLKIELFGTPGSLAPHKTSEPEALLAMSQGRKALARRTLESLRRAIGHFETVISLDPDYAEAHAELASAHALLDSYSAGGEPGHLQAAVAAVNRALVLEPTLSAAWASKGLVHMQTPGETALAQSALERAVELNPNNAMANMWLGVIAKDHLQRERYHQRAFELDPRSPVAAYNVANNYLEAGNESRAMEVFDTIVAADPYFPLAYQLVGRINEFRGRLGEAVLNYRRVYELDPNHNVAEVLAAVYFDMGDFEQGDAWLSKAYVHEMPPSVRWLKAGSLAARGQRDKAITLLQPMLAPPVDDLEANFNAVMAAYHTEDFALAAQRYEGAIAIAENGSVDSRFIDDASVAAAYSFKTLGNIVRSRAILEEVQQRLDKDIARSTRPGPYLWYRQAVVSAIGGDESSALRHLQRAIDEGWRQHWRPLVEPALDQLRQNAGFSAMMAGLATRMQVMREQLALDEAERRRWE